MSELIGFVNKIVERNGVAKATGKPYKAYTVTVTQKDGVQKNVGWAFNLPIFSEGVWIKTTIEQNGEYLNYRGAPLEQSPGSAPTITAPIPTAAPRGAGGGSRNNAEKDKYWAEKDAYSKDHTQPRIQYQAARRDAVTLVGYLLSADALPISEAKSKGAKAERFDQILDYVNKLTVQLYNDTDTLRVLEQVQDAGTINEAPAVNDLPSDGGVEEGQVFELSTGGSPF